MSGFLDKLIEGADKYFTVIGIKTSETAEAAKIRLEIHDLKKEKNEVLMDIGEEVYKMQSKGKFDQEKISNMCKALDNIDEEIKKRKYEMDELHETARTAYKRARRRKLRRL